MHGIADLQRFHCLDKFALEFIGNLIVNDKPFCSDTGLPVVHDTRLDRCRDRLVQIRARHDDERIAAAQFEYHFLDVLRGGNANLDSSSFTPGKRGSRYARIGQHAVDLVGADQQCLKSALGETRSLKNFFDLQRALRDVRRMLQ